MPFRIAMLAVVVGSLAGVASAQECGCKDRDDVKAALESSATLFLGRVERMLAEDAEGVPQIARPIERLFRFEVVEPFKGIERGTAVVGWGPCGCVVPFEEGETYLVYTYRMRRAGYDAVDLCTRTRSVALASSDLEYLRATSSTKRETRLTGAVARELDRGVNRPLAGIKITVVGRGSTREAVTDASGTYRFADVPPGDYEVRFDVPRTDGGLMPSERVSLAQGDWRGPDYVVGAKGRIVGTLLGPDGRPLADARVVAVPLDEAREGDLDSSDESFTGEDGRFAIELYDAGRYVVVANPDDFPTADTPFRRVFFPSGTALEEAKELVVEDGKETRIAPFKIPRLLERATLRGVVVDEHGGPVAAARIHVNQDEDRVEADGTKASYDWSEVVVTNAEGEFSATVLVGRACEIAIEDSTPDHYRLDDLKVVTPRGPETRIRVVVPRRAN